MGIQDENQYELLEILEKQYFETVSRLRDAMIDTGKEVGIHAFKQITSEVETALIKDMEEYCEDSTAKAS